MVEETGVVLMSNVIAFRRPSQTAAKPRDTRGATLFLNIKQTSLIAHLANPQGNRVAVSEKASRS